MRQALSPGKGSAAPRTPACATSPTQPRPEPDLVPDRAGRQAARLDAHARTHRARPQIGTRAATAADLRLGGRIIRGSRHPAAPPRRHPGPWAPDIAAAIRPHPGPGTRLTGPHRPYDREGHATGPRNPTTQRDSQAVTLTGNGRAIPSHSLGSPSQEHERDRLAEAEGGNRSCKGLPTATENTF